MYSTPWCFLCAEMRADIAECQWCLQARKKNLLRGRVGRWKTNGSGGVLVQQGGMVKQVQTRLQYKRYLKPSLNVRTARPFYAKTWQKVSLCRRGGCPGRREKQGEKRNRKSGKKETGNGGEKYLLCFVYPQKYEIYTTKVQLEGSMTCLNLTMR